MSLLVETAKRILRPGILTQSVLALSLATILFLPPWMELLPDAPGVYTYGYTVSWGAVGALLVNLLILTTLLLAFGLLKNGFLTRTMLCFLSLLAVNSLRVALLDQSIYLNLAQMAINLGWRKFLFLYGSPVLALCAWIFWDTARFLRVARFALLILSPLPALLLVRVALPLWNRPIVATFPPTAPPPPRVAGTHPKTPLLIFDEMDQTWTFEARPSRLKLPALDRFRAESVHCSQAYPPTAQTHTSIPSMLTGRVVTEARTAPGRELLLQFQDDLGHWHPWSQVPDLFSLTGQLGHRSLLINHYHAFGPAYMAARPAFTLQRTPYFAEWEAAAHWHRDFRSSFLRQWACLLDALPGFVYFTRHDDKTRSVPPLYRRTLARALQAVQGWDYDLVVIHWPIPHAPAIFDLEKGDVPDIPPPGRSNLDNLALVDRTVAAIRAAMEANGTWDSTLVVLTSDHWQRKAADPHLPPPPLIEGMLDSRHRIPLLVKFPGQSKGIIRTLPINNTEIFNLISSHFREREESPETFATRPARMQALGYYQAGIM